MRVSSLILAGSLLLFASALPTPQSSDKPWINEPKSHSIQQNEESRNGGQRTNGHRRVPTLHRENADLGHTRMGEGALAQQADEPTHGQQHGEHGDDGQQGGGQEQGEEESHQESE